MQTCATCSRTTLNPKFCSKRCAAITNNRLFPKKKPTGLCVLCLRVIRRRQKTCDSCRNTRKEAFVAGPALDWIDARQHRRLWLDLVGLALWRAEGDKNRYRVSVTNSDPNIILLTLQWLHEVYEIPLSKFRMRVQLHSNWDTTEAVGFWSVLTGISLRQFYKSTIIPSHNGRRRGRLLQGVCRICVHDVRLYDQLELRWIKLASAAQERAGGLREVGAPALVGPRGAQPGPAADGALATRMRV